MLWQLHTTRTLAQPDWIEAEDLKQNYLVLLADGSVQKIAAINTIKKNTTVFNIEIEELHNYYVARNGILVHNPDCAKREKELRDEIERIEDLMELAEDAEINHLHQIQYLEPRIADLRKSVRAGQASQRMLDDYIRALNYNIEELGKTERWRKRLSKLRTEAWHVLDDVLQVQGKPLEFRPFPE